MTNKPMLSVGRELLERVTDNKHIDKESISIRRWEAICKLRAILSRQICAKCGNPTACEKPVCEDCCYEIPAAQHHGEPVRWERMSKMEGGKWWPCADKAEADEAATCGWTVRPLYAQQPAPVAAVMPQFDMQMVMMCVGGVRGAPLLTSNQCHALAQMLNACSAEVARLNGVKP